ncbi:hypothetical protein EI94DRAFT_1818818 [Lactarius quietus]|nr:hypothetical protein EI94DRAFT_1818818 [Lactarius quietus]
MTTGSYENIKLRTLPSLATTYILLKQPNAVSDDYNGMSPHESMSKAFVISISNASNTFQKGINPWPAGFRPNIKPLGLHHAIFQCPFHAFVGLRASWS